jgi:hypothetical protein
MMALGNQLSSACMEAYEKAAAGMSDVQRKASAGGMPAGIPGWFEGGGPWGTAPTMSPDAAEALNAAAEHALELGEKLSERSKTLTLACLDACEAAALAVAGWEEDFADACPIELVKTVASMRAAVTREVTKACCGNAREMLS